MRLGWLVHLSRWKHQEVCASRAEALPTKLSMIKPAEQQIQQRDHVAMGRHGKITLVSVNLRGHYEQLLLPGTFGSDKQEKPLD